MDIHQTPTSGAWAAQSATVEPKDESFKPFGEDGISFFDILDIVNPLQHIPVVSTVYRAVTGDTIDPLPRLAGGTLFGGPIGLGAAFVNLAIEENTGKDVGEHVLALFVDESSDAVPGEADFETAAGSETSLWDTPTTAEAMILAAEARGRDQIADAGTWSAPTAAETAILASEARAEVRAATGPGEWLAFNDEPSAAVTAQTIDDVRQEAADIRALEAEAALIAVGGSHRPQPRPAPNGATAADGGWFTDTMLTALEHYRKSSILVGTDTNNDRR